MTKPAATRAAAPVARFALWESLGSAEDPFPIFFTSASYLVSDVEAKLVRNALSDVKYNAEPRPVRSAEGRVPRQRFRTGLGEDRIVFTVEKTEEGWADCWTRVLRRSAGWRRMEDVRPERRPAPKWKVVLEADGLLLAICFLGLELYGVTF
jgi:hypothetical protein